MRTIKLVFPLPLMRREKVCDKTNIYYEFALPQHIKIRWISHSPAVAVKRTIGNRFGKLDSGNVGNTLKVSNRTGDL